MFHKAACLVIPTVLLGLSATTPGAADEFDFEVGIAYDASSSSTSTRVDFGPVLPTESFVLRSDTDNDDIRVFGTWYFDGVSAREGPRSRAAFLSRASSLSFSYNRDEGDSDFRLISDDPAIPSTMESVDIVGDTFAVNLRYVWAESGWYALAGVLTGNAEIEDGLGSVDASVDAYSLGIGRYLGPQTAIDLSLIHGESDASGMAFAGTSSSTEGAITFTHIGQLGAVWQYGADVALTTTGVGDSDGSFDLRFSLFPSRPLAFGIDVNGALEDTGDNPLSYELFVSWFPVENLELAANYVLQTIDEAPNTDFDGDSVGVGVNFRF